MRATDQALPTIEAREGKRTSSSPIVQFPKMGVISQLTSLITFAAHKAKQIFVQFEPQSMVTLGLGVAHPGNLAILRPCQRQGELLAIDPDPSESARELIEHDFCALVKIAQPIKHLGIVFFVIMTIRYTLTVHGNCLPFRDQLLKNHVQPFKAGIAPLK